MKSKLLIIAPYFYPDMGGLENYAYQVAKRLLVSFDIHVICATKQNSEKKEVLDGIVVTRRPPSFFVSNTPIDIGLKAFLTEYINEYDIDIVHAHMPVPYFGDVAARVAHALKKPFVLTFHASQLKKGGYTDIIEYFYRPFLLKTLDYADAVVAVTQKSRDSILRSVFEKTVVIAPGVEAVAKDAGRQREASFVFAGQLSQSHSWKGLSIIIEAAQLVRDETFIIYIAGDGDMKHQYEDMIANADLSDHFVFLGWVDRKTVLDYVQKSCALLIPSVSDAEGFPTVMVEAFSVGTPVIGTRVGGIPELVIDKENGILVDPGDSMRLSNALIWALEHMESMHEMGDKGRKIVETQYTWDVISSRYEEIFRSLLTESRDK